MARIDNKLLFFTTSPRTPAKMIPEIQLLHENFSGLSWNKSTQEQFIDKLAQSDFFEGKGSPTDKAFSARDRINRAPKALGFINLKPHIELTEAGIAFVYGKRPQEIFLRQLLKFQLPSPYHVEHQNIIGTFCIRPYLEILRLVRELEYITFDEFKIFAVQMTDYHKFNTIKESILCLLTREQIAFFIYRFRKFDVTKREQRQRLIDSFVNAVYLYEDKIILTFNYKDGSKTITLAEVESSDLSVLGAPKESLTET